MPRVAVFVLLAVPFSLVGAGPALRIADSGSARSSGFPRMAISGREVVFAWRDRADPPRVRTAVLELP